MQRFVNFCLLVCSLSLVACETGAKFDTAPADSQPQSPTPSQPFTASGECYSGGSGGPSIAFTCSGGGDTELAAVDSCYSSCEAQKQGRDCVVSCASDPLDKGVP